ncbi:MAG: GNAT family N-acetyltransferase [Armatimonadetes bacterium]|nr:GNAT family N-acetyltransferase [Armatimonadota bacterium]MDE2207322.1 GNAT family N-acetyltransferase [Armatimonadota bacterium]
MQKLESDGVGIRVRQLHHEEAGQAAAIDAECFAVPWCAAVYCAELQLSSLWLGAYDNQGLIGVAGYRIEPPNAHIVRLGVLKEKRRQGVGALLTEKLVVEARAHDLIPMLEVRETNLPALALYRAAGFRIVGSVPNYYTKPRENAAILELRDWGGGA